MPAAKNPAQDLVDNDRRRPAPGYPRQRMMTNVIRLQRPTGGFVPRRLTEARLAQMMSRAELAREVGVTGQAVGYYEAGERRPDMDVLLKIAGVLEQPVALFLRPPAECSEAMGARFFRSVGPKSNKINMALDVKTKWLWELVRFLLRYVRIPPPNLPVVDDGPPPGCYSLEQVEAIATSTRRAWGLGDGPIANMVALMETHGVIISRFAIGSQSIDAFSSWIEGRPYIILGSDKGWCCRSRFDAAHELGHLILHRDISQEDLESKRIRDRIEREANWFAGSFLLPRSTFLSEFWSTRLSHLVGLKRRWRVSMQAMVHRCREIGAIDEFQYILFRKQMSKRRMLSQEPLDEELAPEQAAILLKAWRLAVEKNHIPEAGLEEELGFSLELVQRLCGAAPRPLGGGGRPDLVLLPR